MKRLTLCLAALFLAACGNSSTESAADPAAEPAAVDEAAPAVTASAPVTDLLARIDAEPVALWLSLEPLPAVLLERLWQQMDMAGELSTAAYEEMADRAQDSLVSALARELAELDSAQAWAERGIDIEGVAGLHTIGVFPLLHWQLSDADAFAATLERIEAEADITLPRREIEDQTVIWLPLDGIGLALHHDDQFLTAALVPDRTDLLRRVANLDPPATALQHQQVDAFNSARGLRNDSAGFVDFQRLVRQLLDGEDEWLVEARARGPLAQLADEPSCRQELSALTRIFPRKSFGTTEADADSMTIRTRLETESGFGLRLGTMADSPVALTTGRAGLMHAGLAFNLVAARDFARDIVGNWVDQPPECFLFAGIAEQSADWQLALNRPIPPLVTNLHGMRLQIDEMALVDGAVDDVAGTLALFMRNPQMMLGMAQMFSPELAALDLRPGGEPQPVPPELAPDLGTIPAWMGISETGLGLALGDDTLLASALEAGPADSLVFSGGLDLASYSELIELGLAALPGDDNPAADADETLALLATIYSYMHKQVHLGEDGIDFVLGIEIAD